MEQNTSKGIFGVSQAEVINLLKTQGNPEGLIKILLIFVGLLLTPVTLLGALLFYKRGYARFMEPNHEFPRLSNLSPIVRVGMIIGAVLIWVFVYCTAKIMVQLILWIGGSAAQEHPSFVVIFLAANILFTCLVLFWFSRWRGGIYKYMAEKKRHGSARFATDKELEPYREPAGIYIREGLYYNKQGMAVSLPRTRPHKGPCLMLNNLLRPHLFDGPKIILHIQLNITP